MGKQVGVTQCSGQPLQDHMALIIDGQNEIVTCFPVDASYQL